MSRKNKSKFRKWIIIPGSILILTCGLVFISLSLGRNYADDILGELVARQTKGYYSLAFVDLELDVIDRQISVKNLYLKADSSKISKATGLTTLYDVQLEELVINFKSLYKFYFQKQLEIETMRIVDPEIRLQRIGDAETSSFSFQTGNMYKAISDYLTVLKVDYFRIQDGDLNTGQFSLGNIDFQVQNLLLDSVVRNDVFYSETIFLEITNQKFFLPDSIHEISFERFILSTEDSILRFENFAVHPTLTSGVSFDADNDFNVYDIFIPSLSLKGIDYQSAYKNDHLIIDELTFAQPKVFVEDETHGKREKRDDDNSLLHLLFTVFHKIDIGKFEIEASEIDLKINNDETKQRLKSKETNLAFYNISLDTNNYQFNKRVEYFEDIEMTIKDYDYLLPDSIHKVYFESLSISSKDSVLKIDDLNISGQNPSSDRKAISLAIPQIQFNGLDYIGLVNKKLKANQFTVNNLSLSLAALASDTTTTTKPNLQNMYQKLEPFFEEISINQSQIAIGNLRLSQALQIGSANVGIEDLAINEKTHSLRDLFERSNIQLNNIKIDRDSIQISGETATINQDLTEVQLKKWDINVQTKETGLNASFESLLMTDLFPDSLLQGNLMSFRKAILEEPDIQVERHNSGESSKKMELVIEKEIIVKDGRVNILLDSLMLSIGQVDVDFYLGDSTAIHTMNANQIEASSIKNNHRLLLDNWSYDTLKDEMYFEGLSLQPIDPRDSSGTLINGNIPLLKFHGFAQEYLLREKKLIAEELMLKNPEVITHLVQRNQRRKAESDFMILLDQITLDSGQFLVSGVSEAIDNISISDFQVSMFGLNYPTSNLSFYADSLILKSSAILPSLVSGDQLNTGSFTYHSNIGKLSFDSIYYKKRDESLEVLLPTFSTYEMDIDLLLQDGSIKANAWQFNHPQLSIISHSNKESETKEPIVLPIDIGDVSFDNFKLKYLNTSTQKDYLIDSVDINVSGLTNVDTLFVIDLINDMNDYTVSGKTLNLPINEFYAFGSGNYQYSSSSNQLTVEDVQLIPLYDKRAYSGMIENQSDWFDVSIESLDVQGLDSKQILSDSALNIQHIELTGAELYVYRDKRLPFPEDQMGYLPQEQIRSIPFPLLIDTLLFNGTVIYEEHPDDYEITGIISFDNMEAQILHLTNDESKNNETMQLKASGQIVEEGAFDVNVLFELGRPDNRFSFDGNVRDLPLDSLNQMLGPVANVNIRSGYAEEIDFQFTSNDTLAVGDMVFLYKDLKLKVLNAKKHEANFGSGLMSFFANTFVIRSKNPRFLFPRKGTVYFKRDTSKAVFNYWGKSILSGAVSSVGIHKSDRAEKKDEKLQKRQERD